MNKTRALTVTTIAFFFCALFAGAAIASSNTINLKFSTGFSPKHTMQTKVFEPWAKKIGEMTNGQVKVTFFPGRRVGESTGTVQPF